ncbi:hypothetical protein BDZ94DRAFT_1326354 [Collybia nuda]|uniref:Uncharacterized protein n=1 Tax=Collybia nuda TaxID=64659 RepID=A0A9P5XTK1_9AGAR|nr:hypothetical protein BDZ94DRAFT_1326354 [Collybia nuda]
MLPPTRLRFNDRLSWQVTYYRSSYSVVITDSQKSSPFIPVEIISAIVSVIDNTPTLAACTSVNTTFHNLAIPLLYDKVVIAKAGQLPLFLYGIGATATDSSQNRKRRHLCKITSFIVKEIPDEPFLRNDISSGPDLFPSLRYIELEHSILDWDPVIPLLQQMFHVQHVCFRNYKAGDLCPRELGEVLKYWIYVEYLTFYSWYAHYERNDAIRRGVPTVWKKLKEITIYPVLGHQGRILRAPTSRVFVPDPFLFMPDPQHFESLTSFTIMIPDNNTQVDKEMYEGYTRYFQDDQKALVRFVKGTRIGSDWA